MLVVIVTAVYKFEFEVDIDEIDRACVKDEKEFAKELTEREIASMLSNNEITAEDFEYQVIG